jgi:hypothetical protein
MLQTLALLLDAYRELNARKMFWISLIISGVVMGAFALLGVSDKGLTLLGMDIPAPAAQFFYKTVFSNLVIGLWASTGAMILALISTASIFPDLLVSGSIDLYLSKPISRLRLFLTKYLRGLLFVLIQAAVFAVGSYLVFGLRAGQWRTSMFLLIPLVTLLFSYLFAVCVLIGVLTRSTIAAILITCLFWLLCFVANKTEQTLFMFRTMQASQARIYQQQATQAKTELSEVENNPLLDPLGIRQRRLSQRYEGLRSEAEEAKHTSQQLGTWHRLVYGIASVIPKTGETVDLLDRRLFNDADLAAAREEFAGGGTFGAPPPPVMPDDPSESSTTGPTTEPSEADVVAAESRRDMEQRFAAGMQAQEDADRAARSRSVLWVLGTSVGFEVAVVALGAWVFCRRDY